MSNTKHNMLSAEVIEVIKVVSVAGKGTEEDPGRIITEYWSTDGERLAVTDPMDA